MAESFIKVQSQDNLQYALDDLNREYGEKCSEYQKTLEQPDWGMYWYFSGGRDGYKEIYGATKSQMERNRQLHEFNEPLRIDYADKKWAFQKAYLDELDRQKNLAETISLISPSELFRLVCSAVCKTDVNSHYRFMDRTRIYREELINYFNNKKIFSSFLYFTPVPSETFMTADEIVRIRSGGKFKTLREYEEWVINNEGAKGASWRYLFALLDKVDIPETDPNAYSYLDLSDVPMFQIQSGDILNDLKESLFKISALVFSSILLFFLSFISFIKYDVR